MKIILLLAAIYSLIINQCYKTGKEKLPKDTRTAKVVNIGTLIGTVYKQHRPTLSSDFGTVALNAETFLPAQKKHTDAK